MRVTLAALTFTISLLFLPSSAQADTLQYDFISPSLTIGSINDEIPAANKQLATHARGVLVTSILVFSWPSTASADSTDVVTLTFDGSGVCLAEPCGSAIAIVGPFSFDQDTSSIASSDTEAAFTSVGESESLPTVAGGIPWPVGYGGSLSSTSNGRVPLGFAQSQAYYGPVALSPGGGIYHLRFLSETNGSTMPTAATPVRAPEPSPLLLLGWGLFGLLAMASFGSRIRRFAG